jgi:hypothetical protein
MFDLIHITAAYSNAVLIAILPHVSDYAKKLDLPIPQPITLSQVAHAGIDNRVGRIDSGIWLTNNCWFLFDYGYVGCFRLNKKTNPFLDDDPAENWPKYAFGKDTINTNQAMDLVRSSINKLGYDTNVIDASSPPDSFQGDNDLKDGNHFPYCEMSWTRNEGKTNSYYIQGAVDMERNELISLAVISRTLNTTNPIVSVTPQLESDFQKSIMKPMNNNTNAARMFPH